MVKVSDIVIKLKKVKEERGLSYNDIQKLIEKNGDFVSKSTICRVFAKNSEEKGFRYEITIRPIAKALLDIENLEDDDTTNVQAMKSLLKYKIQRIEELEQQLDKEKIKSQQQLIEQENEYKKRFDFLNNQIALKDKRIDNLLETTTKLLSQILDCPCRMKNED